MIVLKKMLIDKLLFLFSSEIVWKISVHFFYSHVKILKKHFVEKFQKQKTLRKKNFSR